VPVHTDAVQAVGRVAVDFHELGVATLAASAHKFHGPVGVGLLLVRKGVRLGSRLFGGGQQQGRRPGTVAVPLAVGLAGALERWAGRVLGAPGAVAGLAQPARVGPGRRAGAGSVVRNGPRDDALRLPQTVSLASPASTATRS